MARGRPTNEAVAQLELVARRQEAGQLTAALRTVLGHLEAILLQQSSEVPRQAFALTGQLRTVADRYDRRWDCGA